jgi:uncharacterized protein YbcC (UPF0753/DUF2309 family)
LASSVAVNPFLGQTNEPLAVATSRLRRTTGVALTMPREWYRDRLRSGDIVERDLEDAYEAAPIHSRPATFTDLKAAMDTDRSPALAHPTVADLAGAATATEWPHIVNDRIGHWAAAYFDQGQALWAGPLAQDAYSAWHAAAIHDLTPEVLGLRDFARHVADLPADAQTALVECVDKLGLPAQALEIYFHRLLASLGGWAQTARYRLWQAELAGADDTSVTDLLTIRIVWETALLKHGGDRVATQWKAAMATYAEPVGASAADCVDAILQESAERAAQRNLCALLAAEPEAPISVERPDLQIAFCIDVRSEVFRRALESINPRIITLGFAGFFGVGINHRRFGSDALEARLPVLLKPGLYTCAGTRPPSDESHDRAGRVAARAKRAWGRFKLAAISSFAFVEATGPIYVGKLLRDGLGRRAGAAPNDPAPRLEAMLEIGARVTMAASVLRAMSLTEGFARLVLLTGHGANVVNNPHASALHCGACGGYSGEVNARLLASLLNDSAIRDGLIAQGIVIPKDTLFLGALHDTTTDSVTIYDGDHPSASHRDDLRNAEKWLLSAGVIARSERALRLPRAKDGRDLPGRAGDWAELRPEWALAGCKAFVAAPRARTSGRNFAGQAFLHDYDWRKDRGFGVLELILTAPVVVASWISLQYYGSTVAPDVFGAGNKLLHNTTGGMGVVEGNGGLLRAGLPWQSIHDGDALRHEPLRLSVIVEAPRETIDDILSRHPNVRALFDNRWLHLFALDDRGRIAWRYGGDLRWEPSNVPAEVAE